MRLLGTASRIHTHLPPPLPECLPTDGFVDSTFGPTGRRGALDGAAGLDRHVSRRHHVPPFPPENKKRGCNVQAHVEIDGGSELDCSA